MTKENLLPKCLNLLLDLEKLMINIHIYEVIASNRIHPNITHTLKDMGYIIEQENSHPKLFKFIWKNKITQNDAIELRKNHNIYIKKYKKNYESKLIVTEPMEKLISKINLIERLAKLKSDGFLNDSEFQKEKTKLLNF